MAIGDGAKAAGYSLVPDNGEEGRVRFGAREINRTRDYIAAVKKLIPQTKSDYRRAAGITTGTAVPSTSYGQNGDIYLRQV